VYTKAANGATALSFLDWALNFGLPKKGVAPRGAIGLSLTQLISMGPSDSDKL
jgi:hypothetical protein